MSLRPLDLQIHINSLNEITRLEGDRMARETLMRRQGEEELVRDAQLRENQVAQTPETAVKHDVEKHSSHFGVLNEEELEVQEFINRHGRHKKEQHKEERTQSEEKDNSAELLEGSHLDLLA
ncbi:MAG: hypothetical protein NZM25_07285 [Leptospiraceae bacterium]|nr:hypothetical protein [Leptospiraceae bacterium]MDW8307122.1 hypothetical protein [Leptospiraceae bacterium]